MARSQPGVFRDEKIMQSTISQSVEYKGVGLHTGKATRMVFHPAPPGTGILFRRVDLAGKPEIPADVDHFQELPVMCACVAANNGAQIQLIEHLMASLNAFGIHNLVIELDNAEPPFENGSAEFLVSMIKEAGIESQEAPDRTVVISTPIVFKEGEVELVALPSRSFRVTFFASYENPHVGTQSYSLEVTPESFQEEIAMARTFCFESDVNLMMDQGLLLGASEDSALVFGEAGLLNGTLLFPDEPVRHKVMDLIGDLYLLGAPLRAHVTAVRSGHHSHARFVKLIRKETGL